MMTINAHSLVGSSTKNCWSQAQSIVNNNQTVVLVLMLNISRDEGVIDLASIGGAVFEKFHEFGESFHPPDQWQGFVESQLSDIAEEVSSSVVIGCIFDETAWVWGKGATSAGLYRNQRLVPLVEANNWQQGLSGKLQQNDILIIGTKAGVAIGNLSEAREALEGGTLNYVEAMAPLIHQQENQAEIAVSLVQYQAPVEPEAEQERERKKFPEIIVKRMSEEPRRFNLVLGGIIGLGLIVLTIAGAYIKVEKKAKGEYETALTRSRTMIAEAESVAETNPERAKILISQSVEVMELYLATEPKQSYLDEAKATLESIRSKSQEILKVRGTQLTPTAELAVLGEGLRSETIVEDTAGSVYFWDDSKRSIVGFATTDLSKTEYKVENERFLRPFTVSEGEYVGLASGGVWRGAKAEQKIVIPTDPEWGEITQIATFGNNIYLLDRGMGEIWKYAATDNGYAERKRWFGVGIELDLSRVVDWVVDGDVWLLTSSGKLEKYARGVPAKFALTGFPSENDNGLFKEPRAVTVVEDVVYVLESGAKRVVAFRAEGQYLEQYVSEDFGRATDLMVYEGKGYVLVDNVIKEWEL